MAKTQFFSGHWLGPEPLTPHKDIVKHGMSQSIRDFIAGNFSGTTPVTDGNRLEQYDDRSLAPNDLDMSNTFDPEIEDRFAARQFIAAREAELLMKQKQAQEAANAAREAEFKKYKEYYEQQQKNASQSDSNT